MRLFNLTKDMEVQVSEEAWTLIPFRRILEKDKTKDKKLAFKEIAYVFHSCDVRSFYMTMDEQDRQSELIKDLQLPPTWEPDELVKSAIFFYNQGDTPTMKLYKSSINAVNAVAHYLDSTEELLQERDNHGKPTHDISKITTALSRVPKLMKDLKEAYTQVIAEQENAETRKKGSQTLNTFEDGFTV